MNPWDVLGWLFVVIVGLIVLSIVLVVILFLVAGIMEITKGVRKKKQNADKYEVFSSTPDNLSSAEIYNKTKEQLQNGL